MPEPLRPSLASFVITREDPRSEDVRALLEIHLRFARSQTPPEDTHALDIEGLLDPAVTFFALRDDGVLLGVGAIKALDEHHAEVKSMHTAQAARGRGVGGAILEHLLEHARAKGVRRVSLETGSMASFSAAVALYERAGFRRCAPFGDYRESPNSVYLTLALEAAESDEHGRH